MTRTFRVPVKHTADDGFETHPEAVIEVQAEDRQHADALVEGLLVAGGDSADWEFGVTSEPAASTIAEPLASALREIIRRAPDQEPEYQEWGGDTEDAETWGQSAGLWEAAQIARAALHSAGLPEEG
jgi:hypothetical protein